MLNLKFIQDNPELVIERLAVKRFDSHVIVEKIIALYKKRNEVQNLAEIQKAEMNQLSKLIGQLFKDGKVSEANSAKEKTVELKEQIKNLEGEFDGIDSELAQLQVLLPNIPSPLVPAGKGADNAGSVGQHHCQSWIWFSGVRVWILICMVRQQS